ncbi:MAG TPA: PAS domain-containing protein [Sphingomonas sp.]|nr:PAS domain-containing protein [Sphingomonas sp.]
MERLRESEERLAATFAHAGVGLCEITLDGRFLRVNDALCRLLGRSGEELLATDMLSISHPDDLVARMAVFEHVVRSGETGSIDKRLLLPNGAIVWVNATLSLLKGRSGAPPTIIEVILDLTERRHAEKIIHENEHWLKTLMEGVPQLLWRAVGEGEWTWSSPQWSAFTGLSIARSTGKGWLDAVHPDDRAHAEHCWRKAQEKGAFHADYRLCHKKEDRWRWFQSRATALRDEKGAIIEWLGSSTDVDELRTLRNQQEVLIAELQHRTRNLIAVTQSIWRQTFRNAATPREAEQQFSDRLNALSRVQGLLSRSGEKPVTIGDLVGMEMEALGAGALADRIHIEGPEVRLRSGIVQTFALALHELATNARKYGALSNAHGRLDISWEVHDGEDRRHLLLEWRETGIVAREKGRAGGYGRELIERALPYSLNARTRFELGETELLCTIDLPLGAE